MLADARRKAQATVERPRSLAGAAAVVAVWLLFAIAAAVWFARVAAAPGVQEGAGSYSPAGSHASSRMPSAMRYTANTVKRWVWM